MTRLVVIGAGGLAREVVELIRDCQGVGQDWDLLGLTVDPEFAGPTELGGVPVFRDAGWLSTQPPDVHAICAIGDPVARNLVVARHPERRFATLTHPRSTIGRNVTLGHGVIVAAGSVITVDVTVGDHVLVNVGSTIGHDCSIGNFATVSPGANVSGAVSVGEGAYIGTGAAVIERVTLGEWSILGAGATAVRDVPANCTAVGVPATVIRQREPGWHLSPRPRA